MCYTTQFYGDYKPYTRHCKDSYEPTSQLRGSTLKPPGKLTIDERRPGDFEGDEGMKCGCPMVGQMRSFHLGWLFYIGDCNIPLSNEKRAPGCLLGI